MPGNDANSDPYASTQPSVPYLMQRAVTALQGGRLTTARGLCETVLMQEPGHPGATFLLANISVQSGDLAKAMELFDAVVARDPNAYEALEWSANLKRDAGQVAEAARICLRLIKMRPQSPGAYMSLGLCYLEDGKPSEAIPPMARAVQSAPQVAPFHHNLARAYAAAGMIEDAVREYKAAIALAPSIPNSYESLGRLLGDQNRLPESIANLRKAVQLSPSARTYTELARSLAKAKEHDEEEKYLRLAIEADSNIAETHEALGARLEERGLFDEAIRSYERAIEVDSDRGASYYGITQSRKIAESDRGFIAKMEALASDESKHPEELRRLNYGIAKAYDDLGEYGDAMRYYDVANEFARRIQLPHNPFNHPALVRYGDRVISTFTKEFFAKNAGSGLETDRPIFIVGMMRSGTTLQEQILSSHPRIAAAGELTFWTEPAARESTDNLLTGQVNERRLTDLGESYRRLLRSHGRDAERVTDKMPMNYLQLGLMHLLFPNARILHCRRDPLDTCISIYTTPFGATSECCYVKKNIVAAYEEYLRLMTHWREVLPADRFFEVAYEDLIANRSQVTHEVLNFCGVSWDDAVLKHEENSRTVRTPSLWQVRQPLYASSVGRWKNYEPWLGEFRRLMP